MNKEKLLKKVICTIMLFYMINSFSQNEKLKLKSFSLAFGGFQPYSGGNDNANFYVSLDGTFLYNKNLFTASLNRGFDLDLYGSGGRYNISFDALYGREVRIFNRLSLEFHAGIGVFRGSYYKNEDDTWKIVKNADNNKNHITPLSISFPSKFKMLFYFSKTSSLGINLNFNINKISNYIAYCVIFQKNI